MDERSRGNKQEPSSLVKRILWLGDVPPNEVMTEELRHIFSCKVDIVFDNSGIPAIYVAALLDDDKYDEVVVVSNQVEILMPFIALDIEPLCPEIISSSIAGDANITIESPCGVHRMRFIKFQIPFVVDDDGVKYRDVIPSM